MRSAERARLTDLDRVFDMGARALVTNIACARRRDMTDKDEARAKVRAARTLLQHRWPG